MFLVVLCLLVLMLHPSSSQFPNHMDLQKVGETIFNNEKYNILKPTTHVVADYFKDFMLRRDNINFPTKRIFLDDNGFRHYWSGFDKKSKSLRKTEILPGADEKLNDKSKSKTKLNKSHSLNKTKTNSTGQLNSTKISKEFNPSKTDDNKPLNSSDVKATTQDGNDIKVVSHKKKMTHNNKHTVVTSNDIQLHDGGVIRQADNTRTVAKTTFFCPFFGVITMSAFID